MRKVAMIVVTMTFLVTGPVFAELDCAQVQKLHDEGQRPADIARTLGVTTPEVQECMAGEKRIEPSSASAGDGIKLPLSPHEIPGNINPVPRGPNQQ